MKENLVGKKYNKIKVLRCLGSKNGIIWWECLCECGNLFNQRTTFIKSEKYKSCGKCAKIFQDNNGIKNRRLYYIWKAMKKRCFYKKDKAYKWYGERGINIFKEWEDDFLSFGKWAINNGYNDNLSIERIDVNGNYEPNNCTWIPMSEQCKNKRNSVKNNISPPQAYEIITVMQRNIGGAE